VLGKSPVKLAPKSKTDGPLIRTPFDNLDGVSDKDYSAWLAQQLDDADSMRTAMMSATVLSMATSSGDTLNLDTWARPIPTGILELVEGVRLPSGSNAIQ
jgi:hypothetical protein